MKKELTNALYPDKTLGELNPGEFMREWRNGRSDMHENDEEGGLNGRAKSTKTMKLTEPMVRYIRVNYKAIGKAKLAEMFDISTAFCYKIATSRAMGEVSEEGPVYEPA